MAKRATKVKVMGPLFDGSGLSVLEGRAYAWMRAEGATLLRDSKAAANQIVHTTAIELARTHRDLVCVTLHPGTVETPFTAKYLGRHPAVPAEVAAHNILTVLDGLSPAQSGGFYDWAGKEVPW